MHALLYVMRHGETAWSLTGQHTGPTDVPLTAVGEAGAAAWAEPLRSVLFGRVWTSPRQRARRTCELAALGAVAEIEPDLAEWDYGDYEGLTSAAIRRLNPAWSLFDQGCPGGESPTQVTQRADRLIARVRARAGNVAVFGHGHFSRVLGVRWIGLPIGEARHFLLGPASLSVLGYEHNRVDEPAIARWNAMPGAFGSVVRPPTDVERWENEGGEILGLARA